jgi:hypothetical protein
MDSYRTKDRLRPRQKRPEEEEEATECNSSPVPSVCTAVLCKVQAGSGRVTKHSTPSAPLPDALGTLAAAPVSADTERQRDVMMVGERRG